MNPRRDATWLTLGIVALVLGGAAAGYWIGHGSATLDAQERRIAALERRVAVMLADRGAEARTPSPPARQAVPSLAAQAAPVEVETAGAPARGPADAPVTIVAFSDFECPFCARVVPTLDRLAEAYGDRVRVVFKHFPLPMHPDAVAAHRAAAAAHAQGRFWAMHDRIFAAQSRLDPASLREHAEAIGLDLDRYDTDLASSEVRVKVEADLAQGRAAGVRGTPTFVVNGETVSGALPFETFRAHVDRALAAESQAATGPATTRGSS